MKERPILFSGPMIRAILDGRKTQTRRLVAPQPDEDGLAREMRLSAPGPWMDTSERVYRCTYGDTGDRLWVRETLKLRDAGTRRECWIYAADGGIIRMQDDDPRVHQMLSWAHHKEGDTCVSIHMPRWASRITLEIASVRVDRLQDISEEDARAEGVIPSQRWTYKRAFQDLWEAINGKRCAWDSNPWVWAVSFRRVQP